tara:strand:- start:43 stop:276 length:234 start_codon:yes stop_codon:yes gene_type:complete
MNSKEIGNENNNTFFTKFLLNKKKYKTNGNNNKIVLKDLFRLIKKFANKAIKHKINEPKKNNSNKLFLMAAFLSTKK